MSTDRHELVGQVATVSENQIGVMVVKGEHPVAVYIYQPADRDAPTIRLVTRMGPVELTPNLAEALANVLHEAWNRLYRESLADAP